MQRNQECGKRRVHSVLVAAVFGTNRRLPDEVRHYCNETPQLSGFTRVACGRAMELRTQDKQLFHLLKDSSIKQERQTSSSQSYCTLVFAFCLTITILLIAIVRSLFYANYKRKRV